LNDLNNLLNALRTRGHGAETRIICEIGPAHRLAHGRPLPIEASDDEYVGVLAFLHPGRRYHEMVFAAASRLHRTAARAQHLDVQFVITE
jgi:hypothetical protein